MFSETLGNEDWLRANEDKLKNILPETWTHVNNLNSLQLGFSLKLSLAVLVIHLLSFDDQLNVLAGR